MKEFNLSDKIYADVPLTTPTSSSLLKNILLAGDVKEFIKRDWVLTNHFLWDLLRKIKPNASVFWIEKMITPLKEKKDKLAGEELTGKPVNLGK